MKSNRKIYYRPYFRLFNQRLNVQFVNKKFGEHFQKSMIYRSQKQKPCGIPKSKVVYEKPLRRKKQYF